MGQKRAVDIDDVIAEWHEREVQPEAPGVPHELDMVDGMTKGERVDVARGIYEAIKRFG